MGLLRSRSRCDTSRVCTVSPAAGGLAGSRHPRQGLGIRGGVPASAAGAAPFSRPLCRLVVASLADLESLRARPDRVSPVALDTSSVLKPNVRLQLGLSLEGRMAPPSPFRFLHSEGHLKLHLPQMEWGL